MFVYAGVKLVFSNGNKQALDEGKDILWHVVVGFLVTICAFLIIDFEVGTKGAPVIAALKELGENKTIKTENTAANINISKIDVMFFCMITQMCYYN